ncbi:MAG: PIG-L family deacetylase [Anaerolineaceae bacterium]|nr:PIG-L family deacetylase [Anaerolineaceae bacterium]
MREWYKTIYLSPHLDDAALSCGGQIFLQTAASHPVLIVTPMAGEPAPDLQQSAFVQELHERWALPQDAVRARRAEDAAACQILGADYLHWAVPDCVYRIDPATGEPCYPTWESVITTRHPADDAVVAQLAAYLRQLPPADEIVVPLTAGNHVDHRLVRQAAEQVFAPTQLVYYEDYPYATEAGAMTAVLTPNLHPIQIVLTETAVCAKIEAIWAYASQRSTFFDSRTDLEKRICSYTAQVGGERRWRVEQP